MDKRLQALMAVCEKLPTDNLNNFRSIAFPDSLQIFVNVPLLPCYYVKDGKVIGLSHASLVHLAPFTGKKS